MDLRSIPKSFWHALSLAILVSTLGLVFIAYRSASVSIEIANAKISLSGVISETEDLAKKLQKENDELRRARREVDNKVRDLQAALAAASSPSTLTPETLRRLGRIDVELSPPIPETHFDAVQANLKDLRAQVKKD